MTSSSEEIVRVTYAGLERFLQGLLDPDTFDDYLARKRALFPTWDHIWQRCEPWLRNHSFGSVPETIRSLATDVVVPDSFRGHLDNSLHLHEEFWNQVYANLLAAKQRLP